MAEFDSDTLLQSTRSVMLYQASHFEKIEQIAILEQTRFLCYRVFAADVVKKGYSGCLLRKNFFETDEGSLPIELPG